jgi:hypothetical protein
MSMYDGPPLTVYSVFGTEADSDLPEVQYNNSFCGVFSSVEDALAAINTECRLLLQNGTLWYRFYVYRSELDDRANKSQDDVEELGERDPEDLKAFYVEFYWKDWRARDELSA